MVGRLCQVFSSSPAMSRSLVQCHRALLVRRIPCAHSPADLYRLGLSAGSRWGMQIGSICADVARCHVTFQVRVEERDDPAVGVPRGRLVVAGMGDPRQDGLAALRMAH